MSATARHGRPKPGAARHAVDATRPQLAFGCLLAAALVATVILFAAFAIWGWPL